MRAANNDASTVVTVIFVLVVLMESKYDFEMGIPLAATNRERLISCASTVVTFTPKPH